MVRVPEGQSFRNPNHVEPHARAYRVGGFWSYLCTIAVTLSYRNVSTSGGLLIAGASTWTVYEEASVGSFLVSALGWTEESGSLLTHSQPSSGPAALLRKSNRIKDQSLEEVECAVAAVPGRRLESERSFFCCDGGVLGRR